MLERAKADAKAELNALFRASGQNGQEELSAAVAAGEQAIDRAGNLDEVAAALQAAKDGIESIRAKGEPPASQNHTSSAPTLISKETGNPKTGDRGIPLVLLTLAGVAVLAAGSLRKRI